MYEILDDESYCQEQDNQHRQHSENKVEAFSKILPFVTIVIESLRASVFKNELIEQQPCH